MNRYGNPNPEGDDRPPGMHDPFEYEDRFMEQVRTGRTSPLMGGWTFGGGPGTLGFGSAVMLAGPVVRGVFLLVTWPMRWAWRRRQQR